MIRPNLRLLWLIPLACIGACLDSAPEEHYVSLAVEDSATLFQRVRIVLLEPEPEADTLDVLWDGPLPEVDLVKRVKVKRYRGGDALIIVRGFNEGQLLYERRITYHGTTGIARVDSPRVRDTIPPVLLSRIPSDTLYLESWSRFPDSLVQCRDARDGLLDRQLDTISRDLQLPSWYLAILYCRDRSRNSTWKYGDTLMVYVRPPPRPSAPVLSLADRDTLEIPVGGAFVPAATCRDEEDGDRPVSVAGKVETGTPGEYLLTYGCADKEGNEATRAQRIWVADSLDVDPPVLALRGPDSLDHLLGTPYADSGAGCMDRRDGPLPVTESGEVDAHAPGVYTREYACRDGAGNAGHAVRKVRVASFAIVPSRAENSVDTTLKSNVVNNGLLPIVAFGRRKPFPVEWASLLAFDLKGVDRSAVKSAKGVFLTYVSSPAKGALDSIRTVFDVYRVKSPWIEGTGNWYYNRGYYQNRGHIIFKNHPMREEIKAASTDPIVRSGFSREDVAMVRLANMEEAGQDTAVLSFPAESVTASVLPERKHLVRVEIDLTRYVKETPEGEDYGLNIHAEWSLENHWLVFVNRKLGDGSMGPYLKISY
jgi:hypothetical protein